MDKSTIVQFWLWGSLLLPFVLLFFLKSDKWKEFVPVGLLQIAVSSIIYQYETNLGFFKAEKNLFFLTDIPPKLYGVLFVGTILIFYFTYGNFLRYVLVNAFFDAFFSFFFTPVILVNYLHVHGGNRNAFLAFFLMQILSFVLYGFHKWQRKAFLRRQKFE